MFGTISKRIVSFLKEEGAYRYVSNIWVYQKTCLVLEILHEGYAFKFDVTPLDQDLFAVDLLKKGGEPAPAALKDLNKKLNLARGIPLEEAVVLLKGKLLEIIAQIDGGPAAPSRTAASAASGAKGRSLKVGVMTLPLNKNFGGNLQAFAMMEKLKQMGHRPVIINRKHPPPELSEDAASLREDAAKPLMAGSYGMPRALQNASFVNAYIAPATRKFHSSAQLAQVIERYDFDAILVGSDQVWRAEYAKSLSEDFFFKFLKEDTSIKRISYAASFGADDMGFEGATLSSVTRLIRRFDTVLVREDSAVDLCRSMGQEAHHVLDPTLLLKPEDYVKVFQDKGFDYGGDRLLAYVLDAGPRKMNLVRKISETLRTEVYATNGLPLTSDSALKGSEGDRSVESWVASFHGAKFVVTDSFHGVAFSILFNRPFIAYGNPRRGMARFTSLLKMFGLEDRLVVNAGDVDLKKVLDPIDWVSVNKRLDELRGHSLDLLNAALFGEAQDLSISSAAPSASPDIDGKTLITYSPVEALSAPHDASRKPAFTIKDVVARDICIGCGACAIATGGLVSIDFDERGMHVARAEDIEALPPEMLAKADVVCPFSDIAANEDELGAPQSKVTPMPVDSNVGSFLSIAAGRLNDDAQIVGSSSGGLTSWILKALLESGRVDGVVHVGGTSEDARMFNYQVSFSAEQVDAHRKSLYYSTSLDQAFETVKAHPGKTFAIVGVPCFIKSARLLAKNDAVLGNCLKYFVGIVCGHMKSAFFAESNAWQLGVPPGDVQKVDFRVKIPGKKSSQYNFAAEEGTDDQAKMMRTSQLVGGNWGHNFFQPNACNYCDDVFAETADIVFGDAWLPKYSEDWRGTNVIVARNKELVELLQQGSDQQKISIENLSLADAVRSQGGGLRHRRAGLSVRLQDDVDQGLHRPQKRVAPSHEGIPEWRIKLIRQRKRLAERSFETFIEAKKTGDLETFLTKMRDEIALYKYLDAHKYPAVDPQAKRQHDVALFGWHHQGNLGGVLTFFALHQILKEIGLSVVVVWRPSRTAINDGNRPNHEILKKYYKYSAVRPAEKLHELRRHCATFVLASDQLWAGQWVPFNPEYEFLGAGDSSVKKISVATSLGGEGGAFPIQGAKGVITRHLLKEIDHISVREPDGVKMLDSVGIKSTQILDPVFLCPPHIYRDLQSQSSMRFSGESYTFGYILDDEATLIEFARDTVSQARGVSTSYFMTTMQNGTDKAAKTKRWQAYDGLTFFPDANLADFVKAIAHAEFVFTDSFHGACMATIFRRPFICAPKGHRGNARFAVFDTLGLNARIQKREALQPEIIRQPIDWDEVEKRLARMRGTSFDWLSRAFERDFGAVSEAFGEAALAGASGA